MDRLVHPVEIDYLEGPCISKPIDGHGGNRRFVVRRSPLLTASQWTLFWSLEKQAQLLSCFILLMLFLSNAQTPFVLLKKVRSSFSHELITKPHPPRPHLIVFASVCRDKLCLLPTTTIFASRPCRTTPYPPFLSSRSQLPSSPASLPAAEPAGTKSFVCARPATAPALRGRSVNTLPVKP